MPVFNAAETLDRAVRSVAAQSVPDWELLLSDDGSRDASMQVAQRLAAAEPRIRLLHSAANTGAAQARNRAIRAAQGRFVAFLDADDEWLPDKLERQIEFMRSRDVAFSYTGFYRVRGGRRREVRVPASVDYETLLGGNVIGCLTAVYDTAAFGKVMMPDLRLRQDFGLWLKLLRRTDRAWGVQAPLALHHRRPGSLSAGRARAIGASWRLYREVEGLSRLKSAHVLCRHLLRRLLS